MIVFLILGILMLFWGIFSIILAIRSRNPRNLISTIGKLSTKTDFKNYRLKSRSVTNAVKYTYTYQVNGKTYQLRGTQLTHSRKLSHRITVVYLRSFPRCAYEEHFSGIAEWLNAVSFTAMGAFLLLLYFLIM